tara:strand:- start:134 stop:514 length:381 start_codon:yes stop_codon:yes gene_type:complete
MAETRFSWLGAMQVAVGILVGVLIGWAVWHQDCTSSPSGLSLAIDDKYICHTDALGPGKGPYPTVGASCGYLAEVGINGFGCCPHHTAAICGLSFANRDPGYYGRVYYDSDSYIYYCGDMVTRHSG